MSNNIILRIIDENSLVYARMQDQQISAMQIISWQDLSAVVKENVAIIFAPTADILLTQVNIPMVSRSKLRQAVPFALEEQLIDPIDELHFVFQQFSTENNLPVAVVNKNLLDTWLQHCQEQHCRIHTLLPDAFALPFEENHWHLFIDDQHALLRIDQFSAESLPLTDLKMRLELALHDNKPPEKIVIDYVDAQQSFDRTIFQSLSAPVQWAEHASNFFMLATQQLTQLPNLNLAQDSNYTSANKNISATWRRIGLLALVFCGIWLASQVTQLSVLSWRNNHLQTQIKQLYFSVFPTASQFIDPKLRIERELSSASNNAGGGTFLNMLILVGEQLLKPNMAMTIQHLNYNNGSLTIEVQTPTFQNLNQFSEALENRGLTVQQSNARSDNDQVTARLTVRGRQ